MEKFTRICRLHRLLLGHQHPVSHRTIVDSLQCSRATINRVIEELRNLTCDPIPYDRRRKGYHYLHPERHKTDLPFLFFTAEELNALLVIDRYLETLETGVLNEALAPLRSRVQALLGGHGESDGEELRRCIRILPLGQRGKPGRWFSLCAEAVLQQRRLSIDYHSRGSDRRETREVSPQRLSHYRDNWYLDAWCHSREELRCFAVERILQAELLEQPAQAISDPELDAHYAASYGIFAGPAQTVAQLRFSAECARWVADEHWHPQQRGTWLPDGRYQLEIPYGNPTELIMDILKHGPDVEVIAPPELRTAVITRLKSALEKYS
ncbi:YafY family protein [Methylococcus sp. EFPC2]|uniref:helix-turn-helix transcriptional regulator n=1 Tax=Methylococcus sp. EFPC2 TaxID=2812648 RepID=UPI0019687E33|nr:WYL domain-containing transcriptional regulator [Methylococcus sp. EFPC2]QSA96044.1 WYL domain-containing transcriptional regulator [Methylococcus sp. EFPC2]